MRSFCQRGMPSELPPAESPPWPLRQTLANPKLLALPRRPRSSEPVAELAARLADAAQAQQTLRAQLHRLRQRERTQRARSRSRWDAMVKFGVMVLTILGADFAWVPNLVSRFQQTADPEEVEEAITEAYLALTAEELEQLLAPDGRVSKGSAVSQAHAFATQLAVWEWVDEANCCTRLAPSVAEVVQTGAFASTRRKQASGASSQPLPADPQVLATSGWLVGGTAGTWRSAKLPSAKCSPPKRCGRRPLRNA